MSEGKQVVDLKVMRKQAAAWTTDMDTLMDKEAKVAGEQGDGNPT